MANEKQTSFSMSVVFSGQSFLLQKALVEDISGTQAIGNVQTVGTSWEAITLGDLASADLIAIVNNSTSNFVQVSADLAGSKIFAKLTPGRFCLLPPDPTAVICAKADTAACDCAIVAVEP